MTAPRNPWDVRGVPFDERPLLARIRATRRALERELRLLERLRRREAIRSTATGRRRERTRANRCARLERELLALSAWRP